MESIVDYLAAAARSADGFIPWAAEREAAARFGLSHRKVEEAALEAGLIPARYARNVGTLGLEGQRALQRARVLVAGCGGLGGHVIEGLARLGVGAIVAVDPDAFDESNMNRQLLCTVESLGRPKAEEAARRVAVVNPAVEVTAVRARLAPDNADELLAGCDLAIDALDSVSARVCLSEAAARLGIPFVHAAVAGWYGQASAQAPGSPLVAGLYAGAAGADGADRGEETRLGNQSYGPAFAAALEVAAACAILIGAGSGLSGRLLTWDLKAGSSAGFDL